MYFSCVQRFKIQSEQAETLMLDRTLNSFPSLQSVTSISMFISDNGRTENDGRTRWSFKAANGVLDDSKAWAVPPLVHSSAKMDYYRDMREGRVSMMVSDLWIVGSERLPHATPAWTELQATRTLKWASILENELGDGKKVFDEVDHLTIEHARRLDPPLPTLLKATPKLTHLTLHFDEPGIGLTLPPANDLARLLPDLEVITITIPSTDPWTDDLALAKELQFLGHPKLRYITLPFLCFSSAFLPASPPSQWFQLPQPGRRTHRYPAILSITFCLGTSPPADISALRVALTLVDFFPPTTKIEFVSHDEKEVISGSENYRWVEEIRMCMRDCLERVRGEKVGWRMLEKDAVVPGAE